MQLSEWIAGTNHILANAARNLPPEYAEILRMQQQALLVHGLETGFLTLNNEPPTFINMWGEKQEIFQAKWIPPTDNPPAMIVAYDNASKGVGSKPETKPAVSSTSGLAHTP